MSATEQGLALRGESLVSTAEAARQLGVGATYITVLKRASGHRGRRVLVSSLRTWLRRHPGFTTRWKAMTKTKASAADPSSEVAASARELRGSRPGRRSSASGTPDGSSR